LCESSRVQDKAVEEQEDTPNKDDVTDVGEIIVTARRIMSRLSQAPLNMSVITEEDIEASGATNVAEVMSELEGVQYYDTSGVGTAGRINLRGFWGGMSTNQLVLIDGVPQHGAQDKLVDWSLIPIENIDRIEIARGPVSTMYGENAMGGVINIITKTGSPTPETSIFSSYGSFNTWRSGIVTSGTTGSMGYLFSLSRKTTAGFREHGDYEGIHFTGKLVFDIDDASEMTLSMYNSRSKRGAYPWALTKAQIKADRNQARPGTENDEGKSDKLGVGLGYSREVGEASHLGASLYFRTQGGESYYTRGATPDTTREDLNDENVLGGGVRYSIELLLRGMKHSLVGGVDLEHSDFNNQQYEAPSHVRGDLQSDHNAVRDVIGVYAEDEVGISDRLRMTLGVRYDTVACDFTNRLDGSKSADALMSALSPRFGLVYTYKKAENRTDAEETWFPEEDGDERERPRPAGRDSSLYANVAKAFRTPTLGHMFTYGTANPDLQPEEAINYEVGVRHQLNKSVAGKLSVYRMKIDNEIWYDHDSRKYQNYGKTTHWGIETGMDVTLSERLKLFGNYTYTDAKNDSGTDKGKYLASVVQHMGNVGLRSRIAARWALQATARAVGSSYLDSKNSAKLPGYITFGTKLTYKSKKATFFFGIEDLFDEDYCSYGFKRSSGTEYFAPAPGRTFTVGLEIKL